MTPRYRSQNAFLSAFLFFTSQDHLEKQTKNLTMSSSTSTVAAGNTRPRCARCCTDVPQHSGKLLSCLQICCFWTSQQSESVLFHPGCHPSQAGACTLRSKGNAHLFQHNLDLVLNNFGFFYFLSRTIEGEH